MRSFGNSAMESANFKKPVLVSLILLHRVVGASVLRLTKRKRKRKKGKRRISSGRPGKKEAMAIGRWFFVMRDGFRYSLLSFFSHFFFSRTLSVVSCIITNFTRKMSVIIISPSGFTSDRHRERASMCVCARNVMRHSFNYRN